MRTKVPTADKDQAIILPKLRVTAKESVQPSRQACSRVRSAAFSHIIFDRTEEGGIALFLLGYHVVLAVKALWCSRRKAPLRSSTESASPSLDRCAATWISPAPGNSARAMTGRQIMTTSIISLIAQLDKGSSRPATSDEIIAAARDHMSRRVRRGTQLSSPKATRDYLSLKLVSLEREVFAVITR